MSMANEAEQVDGWRAKRFFRMGFPAPMVDQLIRWGTSPADVEDLVEAECPFALILRIVHPLEAVPVLPIVEQAEQYSVKV